MLSATGLVLSAPVPMLSAPPDPLLSAPSVPLLRARPSFASCPSILVQPMPARRRLSLRCPCQFVPRCPGQFVPRCPGTSIPAQPVATHSLLPVPVGPRTARRLSTCFRCGGIRSGGSGMTVAASTCRPVVLYIGAAENSDGSTTEQQPDRRGAGRCRPPAARGVVPERALFPPGDDIFAVSCCDIQNFSYLCTRFHLQLRGGPAGFFEKSEKSGNFIPNNLRDKIFMPTFAIQNGEYCRCSSVGQSS